MFKAAFFDIDGTLVSFKTHTVPDSTRRAIDKLKSHGIKCFISSGRHLLSIDNLGDLQFDGYVTVNGGINYYDGKTIDTNPIDKADVKRALDIIYAKEEDCQVNGVAPFPVCFVLLNGLKMNYYTETTEVMFKQLNFQRPELVDLRELADEDIFQMISFFGTDEEPRMMTNFPHCESERWSPLFTDLVPKGQSKVRGMKKLCEIIGASPSEIMAFGDGGNDKEMLRFAGTDIAMGNAVDEVKACADIVCPSVDDNGIEWAVDKLLAL